MSESDKQKPSEPRHGAHKVDDGNGAREARGPEGGPSGSGAAWWQRRGARPLVVALVCFVALAVSGAGILASQMLSARQQTDEVRQEASQGEAEPASEEPELPANPIDFPTLKADHPDIYAWVRVPDTNVDYPVLQSSVDDNYYLRRDLDGNYSLYGSVFTQSMNSTDFTDPVTVIYGHNTVDGTFFTDLHKFEDEEFFDSHDTFYIYMPGHVLTYRIVSAYRYDDRHILNSFDFSNEEVRREYFDYVVSPLSMVMNVREGSTLDLDDRIVQLSTCPTEGSASGNRYLVTGVLVDDQATL